LKGKVMLGLKGKVVLGLKGNEPLGPNGNVPLKPGGPKEPKSMSLTPEYTPVELQSVMGDGFRSISRIVAGFCG
jgi:hypothetical protein